MSERIKEPPWLVHKIDQRLAQLEETMRIKVENLPQDVLMLWLTDPADDSEEARLIWDQSCDRCGEHLPGQLHSGQVQRTYGKVRVVVAIGICGPCKETILNA